MKITRYPEEFGSYRYRLRVEFTDPDDEHNPGNLVVVMFNPATVREDSDLTAGGHTRRRLFNFARDGGYRSMTEVNLFAYRARKKEELLNAVRDQGISPVGPENDLVISEAVHEADMVVAGWGAVSGNPFFAQRAHEATELLRKSGKQLYCIERNKDGSPRNPARGRYILQDVDVKRLRLTDGGRIPLEHQDASRSALAN